MVVRGNFVTLDLAVFIDIPMYGKRSYDFTI